ncbi:MAG: hypothetical protein Phog2KO_41190 [Phototrophicaceae bacterium]
MADETKPITAKEIVNDPSLIMGFVSEYIMLKDTSMMTTYKNMIEAINIFGDYGWETVSMSVDASNNMLVLVRNTNYKRKH